MDTKEFLEALLPEEGVKFLARWVDIPDHPRKGIFMHKPFYDLDEMADNIKWHASKGNTVYHACSSYKEVKYIKTKKGKEVPAGRTQENALAARALWLDFDVGKEAAHSYVSKRDAVDSLAAFVKAFDLPKPMIVDSGNGVHAYFLLEETLQRSEWEPLANKFRAVCDHFGLKYDPSRSSDIASILRPPGSFNLKNPDNPKPVVVKTRGAADTAAYYTSVFDRYIDEHDLTVLTHKKVDFGGLNSDLIVNIEYPDSHAAVIVQHCQQIRQFSETGGTSEPVWYACLGLLKHCVDGEVAAHEWGAKHPDYDEAETNVKMDQWDFGPPTCDKFRDINPEGCDGCERNCKSPIQLGHVMPENVEHTPIQVEDDTTPQEELKVGPGSEFWPNGYRVASGRLEVARENEDGTISYVPLASPPFWLLNEIRDESGEFMLHIRAEIKEGKFQDFDIPTSCTSSADKLKTALAANRVFALSASAKAGFEMQNVVIQQALAMARKRDEINTFTQMGWTPDKSKFLLGDSLIAPDTVTTVRVGSSITNVNKGEHALAGSKASKGTVEEYREGVNHLYNRDGYEAYQYVLAAAVGAYLTPFVSNDEWHGIPMSVYSSRSGFGKTTVAAIGFNAVFRNVKQRSSDSTLNAFKKMLSVYGSLPVFFDELTDKINAAEAKDLLYNWSNGQDRRRLNPDGSIKAGCEMWNNMGIVTTNKSVLYKLTETSSDPEATQVRVLEIDLAEYIPNKPEKVDQKLAIHLSTNVYGVITEKLIRSVMKNRERIEEQIQKEFHDVTNRLPEESATMSRFLCYHAACTIVGAKIGRTLGLWDFSVANIKSFIVKHIKRQLDKITEYRVSPEDRFAAMMADFNGKMLVTYRFDTLDKRRGTTEEPLFRVHNSIVGRYAIGCQANKAMPGDSGRLYIAATAINDWCKLNELNASEIRKEWIDAGLVELSRGADSKGEKSVRLNSGIPGKPMSPARCVEFVVSKVRDAIPEVDSLPKADVVQINKSQIKSQTGTD